MLLGNIENEVREILQRNNGWLRKEQCAKQYARDALNGKTDGTKRTRFYRWSKQVEKGKVKGFQILKLPGNISYIGLEDANPNFIENLIEADTKIRNSVKRNFGLFDWWNRRSERKRQEQDKAYRERLAARWNYLELLAKANPQAKICKDWVKIEKKNRKELGLDKESSTSQSAK